ncbi:aminoglycoside phosphotransferase family protein [Paenibacillus spongiae]|uniref:Aminoglycoside phosphotransferase family protein n=1 Tax=Paenibacillus spongiae TaxID=2909671 RepID=A0ABY5SAI5_9BACL|nr:aminoglycoside phosphotransferase family protein [Paenibacillus spongiae]UVI29308.1 aminoglycoside phosphotransferase family protein [Paenibacillus spongiae]
MNNIFTREISGWSSWGSHFQSIEAFEPLIRAIFQHEKLPFHQIENCTPGTNAVFKVGEYIVKIFAPPESGLNSTIDFHTEEFGMSRANALHISAPTLVASGLIEDRYAFRYLIMDYIEGDELSKRTVSMSYEEKMIIGQKLRRITDTMNTPSESFHTIDILERSIENERWNKYADSFNHERVRYMNHYTIHNKVFVHGDLNADNIILGRDGKLYIIDFADAVLAPPIYEHALVASDLFRFEKPYLEGYFGDYSAADMADLCLNGLLIHDFGADIIKNLLGPIDRILSLDDLRERLFQAIQSKK